jgi:TonB family protein
MRPDRRSRRIPILATLVFLAVLVCLSGKAGADRWICPDCPDQTVERAPDSPELVCPECGKTYQTMDLIPPIAYINSRTRDTEISWVVQADSCPLFREDGLQALDDQGIVFVPWSMVEWYIPRMRLLKLTNGREMHTDYPGRNAICPNPPPFLFEVADSTSLPGQAPSVFQNEMSESMAELFIVAFTPEGRDSARVRFIEEVEGGKQPRLPRTEARLSAPPGVRVPPGAAKADLKADAIVELRIHERRGTTAMRLVKSAGDPLLDEEAMRVARQAHFTTAGEMGVGVPSWTRLHVFFEGTTGRVSVESAPNGFWRR